ncbi:hypothetical protein ACF0H5_009821 [Mactra antiquata]
MNTSGLILLANLLVICSISLCLAQVSFSTNWGTGKRSSPTAAIFKANSENRRQAIYNNDPDEYSEMFGSERSENEIMNCLADFEKNMMAYVSLLMESELRKTKQCLMTKKEFQYD